MTNTFKTILAVLLLIVVGVFMYFTSDTTLPENTTDVDLSSVEGCYVAKLNQDIYSLKIQSAKDGAFSGLLAFNNFEKDSSSGTVSGTYKDGILLGDYSFNSEGMDSVMQVIFKKDGNNFIRGFGDVVTVGDKVAFKDLNAITYDPTPIFVLDKDCIGQFTDSNNIFSFDYNVMFKVHGAYSEPTKDWRLNSNQDGVILAQVFTPRTFMPKTNFSDATLNIARSTDTNAIASCVALDVPSGEVKGEIKKIGEYPFTQFYFSGAGAGNFYETTSYRGIVDGDCYVVEYTIHSTNIGNYSPEQGVKEFDKTKIKSEMEAIVNSLKFLINSD